MIDILPFHKISRPVIEGGIDIDCRPRGSWKAVVRRTDGTEYLPFGDNWIENGFFNSFVDAFIGGGYQQATRGYDDSANTRSVISPVGIFFYATGNGQAQTRVGTSNTPFANSQTALQAFDTSTASYLPYGNGVTMSPSTGNVVLTIARQFAPASSNKTYREAGLTYQGNTTNNGNILAMAGVAPALAHLNRVVFPQDITLLTGEVLILFCSIIFPTLAVTGLTISTPAQNGMDISGVLKLIGTQAAIAGGTVTPAGVWTNNTDYPYIPSQYRATSPHQPVFGLTTATSHPAFNTNTTGMIANQVTAGFGPYTNGQRFRDITGQWGVGTPATDTAFRSITLTTTGTNGYQLLLNNEMTKAANATMNISLRLQF
jgi:hypothetical protein